MKLYNVTAMQTHNVMPCQQIDKCTPKYNGLHVWANGEIFGLIVYFMGKQVKVL